MKKLKVLFLILSLLIITGCKTTKQKNKTELPPTPQRQYIEPPKNLKEYAELINYYEHLVQEWEAWSEAVIEIVN